MRDNIWANKLAIYCSSTLKELEMLRKRAKTNRKALSLTKLYPEPAGNFQDLTVWRINNWNCTQDVRKAKLITVTSYSLIYTFLTIDSPPINWVLNISAHYPNCTFYLRFVDYAIKVFGSREIQNGREMDDFYHMY